MGWYWYFATLNKDKFSLSPIFLDFTVERYITGSRTWLRCRACSQLALGRWHLLLRLPQLSPSVFTIFALYDHLADVVGGRSATTNPLNEHWMADCTIIYSLTWIYKGQQGAPIIFPLQSWHEAAFGKGTLHLAPKNFQKKWAFLHFFHATRVKIFWAFPCPSRLYFMPLIARKNQGSTPMPLLSKII